MSMKIKSKNVYRSRCGKLVANAVVLCNKHYTTLCFKNRTHFLVPYFYHISQKKLVYLSKDLYKCLLFAPKYLYVTKFVELNLECKIIFLNHSTCLDPGVNNIFN